MFKKYRRSIKNKKRWISDYLEPERLRRIVRDFGAQDPEQDNKVDDGTSSNS